MLCQAISGGGGSTIPFSPLNCYKLAPLDRVPALPHPLSMSLANSLRALAQWPPFDELPRAEQAKLAEQIQPLQLRPGQKLTDFGEFPPGIVLVARGQLRLLSRDDQGDPFTLERLGPGQTAGVIPLLRGTSSTSIAAAELSQIWFLPAESFLQVLERFPQFQKTYARPSLEELYGVAELSKASQLPSRTALLNWVSNLLAEHAEDQKVLLLPPGEHQITVDMGPLLLSSNNVDGLQPGQELNPGQRLRVLGRLPARVLTRPRQWPPKALPVALVVGRDGIAPGEENAELIEPEWLDTTTALVPYAQSEALEDWYGRLWADGTFPHHSGQGPLEEALACLRMLARQFDMPFRRDVLRRVLADQLQRQGDAGLGAQQFAGLCDLMGLRASLLELRAEQLPRVNTPALVWQQGHPRVIWMITDRDALVSDPRTAQSRVLLQDLGDWSDRGTVAVLSLERSATTPTSRFGLSWFWPAIRQHQVILTQVLIASFFVQLFALLNPLLIQQIIDAVITQGNFSSLNVLGTLLVGMAVAQAVLGSLRTYLFSDTTNRIDITLGSTIIDHLLRLPLSYFARRPVGEVSSRVNELEKIRRFLTGTALTAVLDGLFSIIYIAVMLLYSVQLTFWTLAVVPFFVAITVATAPTVRKQLRDRAEANSRSSEPSCLKPWEAWKPSKARAWSCIVDGAGNNSMEPRSRPDSAIPSQAPPLVQLAVFSNNFLACWCCGLEQPWSLRDN